MTDVLENVHRVVPDGERWAVETNGKLVIVGLSLSHARHIVRSMQMAQAEENERDDQ